MLHVTQLNVNCLFFFSENRHGGNDDMGAAHRHFNESKSRICGLIHRSHTFIYLCTGVSENVTRSVEFPMRLKVERD